MKYQKLRVYLGTSAPEIALFSLASAPSADLVRSIENSGQGKCWYLLKRKLGQIEVEVLPRVEF